MARGQFYKLVVGNMRGGKTDELMRLVKRLRQRARKNVLVVKPNQDTRSTDGFIESFDGEKMEAITIPATNPWLLFEIIKKQERKMNAKIHILAFDEVQFYEDYLEIYKVIDALLEAGYNIICAGLLVDFKAEPFVPTCILFALLENFAAISPQFPFCDTCGENIAFLPQRLINGEPAPYTEPQISPEGEKPAESYQVRCRNCHQIPGKPSLPIPSV